MASIIAINLYCIGNTVQAVFYKTLATQNKITLLEYTILRTLFKLLIAMILLGLQGGLDPFTSLPANKRLVMLGRAICGFTTNIFLNTSIELIPFSILVVIF